MWKVPKGFVDFLKTCSDLELIQLQHEARKCGDVAMKDAVLIELGVRQKRASAPDPGVNQWNERQAAPREET